MRHSFFTYTALGILLLVLIGAKEQCEIASIDRTKVERDAIVIVVDIFTLRFQEKSISLSEPQNFELDIQNPYGDVSIKGEDSEEIKIEVSLYSRIKEIDNEILKQKASITMETIVKLEESDSSLNLIVFPEEDLMKKLGLQTDKFRRAVDMRLIEINFTIILPKNLKKIAINSAYGAVTVKNTKTNLEIKCDNGTITTDIEGEKSTFFATNSDMTAKIDGGEVLASGKNSFFNFTLNNPQGGKISLANGNIKATIKNPEDLEITAKALKGKVNFIDRKNLSSQKGKTSRIIGTPKKELLINATNGNIKIKIE